MALPHRPNASHCGRCARAKNMENNTNTNKQEYTFCNMKQSVTSNNKSYISVTAAGLVIDPQPLGRTNNGKEYINFVMPIQGHGPRIWQMCGMAPTTAENGTIWARVSMWERTALRFEKFLQKHPSACIVVTGSMQVRKSMGQDGKEYHNTHIIADDFMFVRDVTPTAKSYEKQTKETISEDAANPNNWESEFANAALPF